jgi:hypothetical protein
MPKVQVVQPVEFDFKQHVGVQPVWDVLEVPVVGASITDRHGQLWTVVSVADERDGFLETVARIEVEPAE